MFIHLVTCYLLYPSYLGITAPCSFAFDVASNIHVLVAGGSFVHVHVPVYSFFTISFRFHSCHEAAMQALYALKARAEYELLTVSMQVSIALWMCRNLHVCKLCMPSSAY